MAAARSAPVAGARRPLRCRLGAEPTDAATDAGAAGAVVKASPPAVLAERLDATLDGHVVRPAPSVAPGPETLSAALRAGLSARRQKLLRLLAGGASVEAAARELGMTDAEVGAETRVVMDIVRGRGPGG